MTIFAKVAENLTKNLIGKMELNEKRRFGLSADDVEKAFIEALECRGQTF